MDWMASCNDVMSRILSHVHSGFFPQFRRLSDERISDSKLVLECEWFSYVSPCDDPGTCPWTIGDSRDRLPATPSITRHPVKGDKAEEEEGWTYTRQFLTSACVPSVTPDHSDCVEAGGGGWRRERTWLHNSSSAQKPDTHLQTRPQHL